MAYRKTFMEEVKGPTHCTHCNLTDISIIKESVNHLTWECNYCGGLFQVNELSEIAPLFEKVTICPTPPSILVVNLVPNTRYIQEYIEVKMLSYGQSALTINNKRHLYTTMIRGYIGKTTKTVSSIYCDRNLQGEGFHIIPNTPTNLAEVKKIVKAVSNLDKLTNINRVETWITNIEDWIGIDNGKVAKDTFKQVIKSIAQNPVEIRKQDTGLIITPTEIVNTRKKGVKKNDIQN